MQRVTEYKEKALQALHRSDSPSKLRKTVAASEERLVTDENKRVDPNRATSPGPTKLEHT